MSSDSSTPPTNDGASAPTSAHPGDTVSPGGAVVPDTAAGQPSPQPATYTGDASASPPIDGNEDATVATNTASGTVDTASPEEAFEEAPVDSSLPVEDQYDFPPEDSDISDPDIEDLEWTASEFVHHEKTMKWYGLLFGGTVVLAAAAFFVTKDIFSVGTIIIIGAMLAFLGSRKPRDMNYRLDSTGLTMGKKHYTYEQFRSFAVMDEGSVSSISLYPLQRFMPLISIYFSAELEEAIVDTLSNHLPMEEHERDALDSILHKIRL